jgi:hypothetical protein
MSLERLLMRANAKGADGSTTPSKPDPFIPPSLRFPRNFEDAQVVLISAPAAVGKSTLAKWIANETNAHFIDLGRVYVGSQGFIGDLAANRLQETFFAGDLTVIVDALDEGLVRSGFDNFQAFFADLAATLREVRLGWGSEITRLILFGREEYVELTDMILRDAELTFTRGELLYLSESQATELVLAYAKRRSSSFHEGPSRAAVKAFFVAAARALDLDLDKLWSVPIGRGFVGYPPVLRAVAEAISPNPAPALAAWEAPTEWRNAWQLLTETAERLLHREQTKLIQELDVELPDGAYDSEHQLKLLARRLTGQAIDYTYGLSFKRSADEQAFVEAAEAQLEVHPFLTEGASDVFGSLVAAAAIARGERLTGGESKFGDYSRWPFMWRFFTERIDRTAHIDGESLGWILASLWSGLEDPGSTTIHEAGTAGEAVVQIVGPESNVEAKVLGEVVLRGIARNLEVELPREGLCFGRRSRRSDAAVFVLHGFCLIEVDRLRVEVPEILLEARATATLKIDHCESPVQKVRTQPSARLKVSKAIYRHPWSQVAGVVDDRNERAVWGDLLDTFLEELAKRLPPDGRPAFLDGNGRPLSDDNNFGQWDPGYHEALGSLMRQLVGVGAVTRSKRQAHGPVPTFTYRPEGFTWQVLEDGVPRGEPWTLIDWSKVSSYL